MVEAPVYEAMAQPVVGYLDPYFFEIAAKVRDGLRQAFGTANPLTIAISGTGSSGMETAVANFVEPDSRFAVFVAGYFGDRLCEMGRRQGAQIARCEKPWGETFSDEEAAEFIQRAKPHVVAFVHAETSTGALQDGKAIATAAHDAGALVIADCVTSLGGIPVNADSTGIDIAYSCTQKGLSCPSGLAPFTASPRAMEWLHGRKSPMREWYLDLRLIEEYYDAPHRYHHTASATLFYGLAEGLRVILDEGLEKRFARHCACHQRFVKGLDAMGVAMHVAAPHRIPHLNTPVVPAGVSDVAIRKYLLDKHAIEIAGGFGPLAGKILRIGLMGPLATPEHTDEFLGAFDGTLRHLRA